MTSPTRRGIGVALVASAAVLVALALVLWTRASDDAEAATLADQYAEVLGAGPAEEVEPDRTPALLAGGVAAVLFVSGVVVLATTPRDDG
jgi:hypothetical protein